MKKLFYPVAILAAMMVTFASCKDKGNENESNPSATVNITASIADVSVASLIKRVRAACAEDSLNQTIASTSFTDGGFNITLSGAPDAMYMYKPFEGVDSVSTITFTNPNVLVANGYLEGFSSESGDFSYDAGYEGDFSCTKFESGGDMEMFLRETNMLIIYADGDFLLSGSADPYEQGGSTVNTTYNLSGKKGWNVMYSTTEAILNMLTGASTVNLIWSTSPVGELEWVFEAASSKGVKDFTANPARKKLQEIILQVQESQRFTRSKI